MRWLAESTWMVIAKALGARRAYRVRYASRQYAGRLLGKAKGFARLSMARRLVALTFLVVLLEGFWLAASLSGRVVVLPFDVYGEKDDDALSRAVAASLTVELNSLRDLYSARTEARMAERLTNAREFSRQVVIPRLKYLGEWQPLAVQVEPLRLGPVSLPIHKLAAWVPKLRATVMTGTIEHYGERVRLVISLGGEPPIVIDGRSGSAFLSTIEVAAHQIVATRWTVNATQRPESLIAFTRGLREHLDYVVSRNPTHAAAAQRRYREALSLDRAWDLPRLNLASLLYDQFEPHAMREASQLFREVAAADPASVAAVTGQLNAATQMLERFYGVCSTAPEDVEALLGAWKRARSLTATGLSAIDAFNLHLARGIASYLFGRLQHRHRCAGHAAANLHGFDAAASFELAEAELLGAQTALDRLHGQRRDLKPRWSIALRDLPIVDREYADYLEFKASAGLTVDQSRRLRAVELLERARTRTEEVIKNPSEPYMHGFLAEILLARANLDPVHASGLVGEAMRLFELERALASDKSTATWATLRLSETAMSTGDWRHGMRTFVDALQALTPQPMSAVLRECSRQGLFVIADNELSSIAPLLEKAVSDRYDWLSSIGHALLADVYSRQGRHSDALAKGDRARELVDPRSLRGTRLWYGPELRAKIALTRGKVHARHRNLRAAVEEFEIALSSIRGRDVPSLTVDVIEVAEVVGDSATAGIYRSRLLPIERGMGRVCLQSAAALGRAVPTTAVAKPSPQ